MINRDVYIFLDIDGVLNNVQSFERQYQHSQKGIKIPFIYQDIDVHCVMVLKQLCQELPNCHIILSSSWRKHSKAVKQLEALFRHHNLPPIESKTPYLKNTCRGVEIEKYCKEHNISFDDIVILDDEDNMAHVSNRLILTDFNNGGLKKKTYKRNFKTIRKR